MASINEAPTLYEQDTDTFLDHFKVIAAGLQYPQDRGANYADSIQMEQAGRAVGTYIRKARPANENTRVK